MSPHRLCRYSNIRQDEDSAKAREVFGAHTDSSFITAVPVAAVSGLEVYDEDEARWYRPELAARLHWQQERTKRGDDPNADTEIIPGVDENEDDVELPWHARYVVLVPGEFLQIVSRDEVPSAVHRVVAVQDGPARLSAPILLRGRPGTKLDVARYLGGAGESKLVAECDGKSMDEIHNTMQPSSFQ
jgi:isopenicillin N synthase-like dioxygenase